MSLSKDLNKPQADLTVWVRGDSLTAKKLNEPVDAINRMTKGIALPQQVRKTATGKGGGAVVAQVQLTALGRDLNMCKLFLNGVASGEAFPVAKPQLLRHLADTTTRNGITYTRVNAQQRTATNGTVTETHVVSPAYVVGDVFYAESNLLEGPIKALDSTGTLIDCDWVDQNTDARAWRKKSGT